MSLETERTYGAKVEERDASTDADEVEDVGNDADVADRARGLGQDVGENIGGDEGCRRSRVSSFHYVLFDSRLLERDSPPS